MPRGVPGCGGSAAELLHPSDVEVFPNLAHFGYVLVFIFKSLP